MNTAKSKTGKFFSKYGIVATIACIVLFVYLICARIGIFLPFAIFWVALILVLAMFMLQLLYKNDDETSSIRWIFPVLLALVWLLKTILVPVDVPFFGSDSYVDTAATIEIRNVGWFNLSPWQNGLSAWINSTNYPFLSGLTISLIDPIHFGQYSWSRWGLVILSLLSLCFVYAINFELFRSRRVALLGSIGFGLTYMYLMFNSLYIRETLAFIFFFAVVYCVIKIDRLSKTKWVYFYQIAAIITATGLVFTHHLTGLMLSLFLLNLNMVKIFFRPERIKKIFRISTQSTLSWTLWIFILVALLTFWIYLKKSPINILQTFIDDAVAGETSTTFSLPTTVRYNFLFIVQVITTLFFGFLAIIGVFDRKEKSIFLINSISWGAIMGLASMFFAVAGIPGTSSISSRFELYGYAFLIPAASYSIFTLIRSKKWMIVPISIVFIAYAVVSVYRLPLYLFSQVQPDFLNGEARALPVREEFLLINKFNPSEKYYSTFLSRWIKPISGITPFSWPSPVEPTGKFALLTGERAQIYFANNILSPSPEKMNMSRVYSSGRVALYISSTQEKDSFDISQVIIEKTVNEPASPEYAWVALFLEFVLIGWLGCMFLKLFTRFKFYEIGLGITIVFDLIFLTYIITNALGYKSPGYLPLFVLGLLAIICTVFLKKKHIKILTSECIVFPLICLSLLAYAYAGDNILMPIENQQVTEFYIKNISPCDPMICLTLHITNYEGHLQEFSIPGVSNSIKLQQNETWEQIAQLPDVNGQSVTINLLDSNGKVIDYLLVQPMK
ncbi:MAG TPA: hypothetical protein VMC09_02800 [Anaerolineales bacterium]|nr:hypothetical protein [Anaerolineales bacterium]